MSAKPKIAVLIDWYLPGTKAGGPVRSIYSLITLLKNEFDFYVLTSNKDLGSTNEYEGIKADTLFSKDSVNYFYFSQHKLKEKEIMLVIKQIDPALIYVNSFWSLPFSISIVRAKKQNRVTAPVILAPRGMLSPGALGLKPTKKRAFLMLSKIFGWHRNITFHASNEQEKNEILTEFPKAIIRTAPNVNSIQPLVKEKGKTPGELKLFYLSRVARVKNLHFALEALNNLSPRLKVQYDIYGNIEDDDYWTQCKKLIAQLPENITVSYMRELRFDEIQNTVSNYDALFLPTFNENFGHSIVESLMSGCPVIISDQTPWNDLEFHNAGYALPLNNKQAFVNALTELADLNQEDFNQKSKNAITYISSKLNLEQIRQQYISLFNESIKN